MRNSFDTCEYLRMQDLIWRCQGLNFPTTVRMASAKELAKIMKVIKDPKILVVNFKHVSTIESHSFTDLAENIKSSGVYLACTHADQVVTQIKSQLEGCNYLNNADLGLHVFCYGEMPEKEVLINSIGETEAYEVRHMKYLVEKSFTKHPNGFKRLRSTPLLANGIFNARKLSSDPETFREIVLYLLDKLNDEIERSQPTREVRLLSVSLRASAFAGALALLSGQQIEIVDHMGPELKIFEEYSLRNEDAPVDYILIYDFVIGGAEIKIAQTYAYAKGSRVSHALGIGKALKNGLYGSDITVSSLVDILDLDSDVKYKFDANDDE